MISQQLACSPRTIWSTLLILGLAMAACAGPSSAAQDGSPPATWRSAWRPGWLPGDPAPEDATLPPVWTLRSSATAGLFIALDPVTRLPIAPSAEQKRALVAQAEHDALLAPTRPLQVERLPGGGEIIHLNGLYQTYSIARRDAKGRIITDCATDPAAARKLLKQTPPAKIPWEEK